MAGDSHTAYPSNFGACAFAGAGLIASAFGAGLAAVAAQRRARWEAHNRDELECLLDLAEHRLARAGREIEDIRIDNAKLRAAQRRITLRRLAEAPEQP